MRNASCTNFATEKVSVIASSRKDRQEEGQKIDTALGFKGKETIQKVTASGTLFLSMLRIIEFIEETIRLLCKKGSKKPMIPHIYYKQDADMRDSTREGKSREDITNRVACQQN